MNCAQVNKLKEAYVDGRLGPDVRAAIDDHAEGCLTCRQRLRAAAQLHAGLGGALKAALEPIALPAERKAALLARLAPRRAPIAGFGLRRTTLAAGVFALV